MMLGAHLRRRACRAVCVATCRAPIHSTAAVQRGGNLAQEMLEGLRSQVKTLTAERDAAEAARAAALEFSSIASGRVAGKVSIVTGGGGGLGQAQYVFLLNVTLSS